ATMRVGSNIIASWVLTGDSSTAEGALEVVITADPANTGPNAAAQAAADAAVADAAEAAAAAAAATAAAATAQAAAAEAAAAAAAATAAAIVDPSFVGFADARGRLRLDFVCPTATIAVEVDDSSVRCNLRNRGRARCRGIQLAAGQAVTATCSSN
ncbi:MAG: hypothetical protein ABGY96_30900, partial [bacterium]